mmetsp:Transcript_82824/g.165293  ORF Transcript_82824/g.165293 Transcript_82824/m.165293 type:complete len:216 (-) Transcript_82824:572-1219(-)
MPHAPKSSNLHRPLSKPRYRHNVPVQPRPRGFTITWYPSRFRLLSAVCGSLLPPRRSRALRPPPLIMPAATWHRADPSHTPRHTHAVGSLACEPRRPTAPPTPRLRWRPHLRPHASSPALRCHRCSKPVGSCLRGVPSSSRPGTSNTKHGRKAPEEHRHHHGGGASAHGIHAYDPQRAGVPHKNGPAWALRLGDACDRQILKSTCPEAGDGIRAS